MAKKTRTELSTLAINTNLPDNTTELITPTTERAQLTDERESVVNYKDDFGGATNAGKFLTVATDGESLTMVDGVSGTTLIIAADGTITLYQPNSDDPIVVTDSYNIGGGNIANVTGLFNVGFGKENLNALTSAYRNNAFGHNTLFSNTEGDDNIGIGFESLYSNTIGDNNISIGSQAMRVNTKGVGNIAIGHQALTAASGLLAIESNYNTAVGHEVLRGNLIGYENTALGYESQGTATGFRNLSIGVSSLEQASGSNNICIGNSSGKDITTGYSNVIIGGYAGTTTLNNSFILSSIGGTILQSFDSSGDATFSEEIFIGGSGYTTNPPTTKIGMYTSTRAYIQQVSGGSFEVWSSAALPLVTISSGGLATFSNGIQFGAGGTLDAYEEVTATLRAFQWAGGAANTQLGTVDVKFTRVGNIVNATFLGDPSVSVSFTCQGFYLLDVPTQFDPTFLQYVGMTMNGGDTYAYDVNVDTTNAIAFRAITSSFTSGNATIPVGTQMKCKHFSFTYQIDLT